MLETHSAEQQLLIDLNKIAPVKELTINGNPLDRFGLRIRVVFNVEDEDLTVSDSLDAMYMRGSFDEFFGLCAERVADARTSDFERWFGRKRRAKC